LCPCRARPTRGKRVTLSDTGCVTSPSTTPGLGPPRPWNETRIQLSCLMPNESRLLNGPDATRPGGGQIEQGRPGTGRPFNASVLLLANFLASALASERRLHAFLFTGFEIKGVALNLLNNVFLLHFALEAAQSVLKGFTLLQSNFRQTDTPPNPSGRTE
jgi:hypothetical protein